MIWGQDGKGRVTDSWYQIKSMKDMKRDFRFTSTIDQKRAREISQLSYIQWKNRDRGTYIEK